MILTADQLQELIKTPKNSSLIKECRRYSKTINMHVTGKGLNEHFEKIKDYENATQLELRKKYARSNKDLYARLLRLLDKIYNTHGGAKYFNLSDSLKTQFSEILVKIRGNQSLTDWLEKTWKRKRITDPSGILLAEISKDGTQCYPTYKSIHTIRDYIYTGNKLEYIQFEPIEFEVNGGKIQKIRIIDDAFDYMFQVKDGDYENATQIIEETLPNIFGKVPGLIISNEFDENDNKPISFIDETIDLAEEILLGNSVKSIWKIEHGYPGYWEYARECPVCNGEKVVNGHECEHCHGTGERQHKDVSDVIRVHFNEDGTAPTMPPAGYIKTDVDTWKMMNEDETFLEKLLHKTTWGTLAFIESDTFKTATEINNNTDAAHTRLYNFSVEAENVEEFFTNIIGFFHYGVAYKGSTIIYGKRFQLENADQLLTKLADAKKNNVPFQTQKNIYIEYLQTQYSSDSYEMSKQLKILKIDLYPLYTVTELKNIGLPQDILYKKILTGEWINTLTDNDILFQNEKTLISKRDIFINENITQFTNQIVQ